MTAITRVFLDAVASRRMRPAEQVMWDALRRVLDLRDDYAKVPHTVHMVRGLDAALAGTQTDACEVHLYGQQDGEADICTRCGHRRPWGTQTGEWIADANRVADETIARTDPRDVPAWAPAPSSPDRIDTTEAVRLAAEAITALPAGQWHAEGKARVAVAAALPALAEQFAALIEAMPFIDAGYIDFRRQYATAAARLVREAAGVTG